MAGWAALKRRPSAAKAGTENTPVIAAVNGAPPKIKCNAEFFRKL
jgi:hypothetical protein